MPNQSETTLNEFQDQCGQTALYGESIDELLSPIYEVLNDASDNNQTKLALERLDQVNKLIRLTYGILGWAGEVGEVCNKAKKVIRDGKDVSTLIDETRDASWYQNIVWSELGVTADAMASALKEKLFGRKERGTLKGSGDVR